MRALMRRLVALAPLLTVLAVAAPAAAQSTATTVAVSVALAAIVVGFAVAFLVTRRITGGVREVRRGLERVAAGDLTVRLPVHGTDEIGAMATALNAAADSKIGKTYR